MLFINSGANGRCGCLLRQAANAMSCRSQVTTAKELESICSIRGIHSGHSYTKTSDSLDSTPGNIKWVEVNVL